MTRRLILIRHAKSSWDDPTADDHARVLNARGRASAQAIGAWLAEKGHSPDRVLCSDAARTQQTAALVLESLTPAPDLRLAANLYHAAPMTLLDRIQTETAQNVAVIGHNPGIGMLANMLLGTAPDHPRFLDYPTAATTVMDFPTQSWSDVRPKTGRLIDFIIPADLSGSTRPA